MARDRERVQKQNEAVRASTRQTLTENALLRASALHLNMENRRLLRKIKETLRKPRR